MKYQVFRSDGREVHEGETITSFRDEAFKFVQVTRQGSRVYAESETGLKQEYFPSVFNLTIEEVD